MRRTLATGLLALAAVTVAAVPASAAVATKAGIADIKVIGLTSTQRLVIFEAGGPGSTFVIGKVAGLKGDRKLVGIDYRVQDGKLYGVGDKGGVYVVNATNARTAKVSQLTVALSGKSFGVDFNPAANRLRVISDNGQNLRHNIDDPMGAPAAGSTVADGPLTNLPVPPATTGAKATGVTAAAYTNNDLNPATATTLFDLAPDQVVIQSPANAGSLAPTGKLGLTISGDAGFDIYSTRTANRGYATLKSTGGYRFYTVDLLTGRASSLGAFPAKRQVVDIAIPLKQN
ncbi:hypothetical protein Aph01nite_47750 [Acrocarpospora phusangensis]|uniref:DUF4394 domain-containing protein n=1 Tax=Acrocarpospora phusangensis TaxID=1070424 RepID=A0A919USI1_9ACTN|nr:DUF4394 domain-containing protein [Acrocarpospora phusangensis]GIH26465.1 hypothetical protein Aph01nite_47750 [Acrocarpospora phusangensis]